MGAENSPGLEILKKIDKYVDPPIGPSVDSNGLLGWEVSGVIGSFAVHGAADRIFPPYEGPWSREIEFIDAPLAFPSAGTIVESGDQWWQETGSIKTNERNFELQELRYRVVEKDFTGTITAPASDVVDLRAYAEDGGTISIEGTAEMRGLLRSGGQLNAWIDREVVDPGVVVGTLEPLLGGKPGLVNAEVVTDIRPDGTAQVVLRAEADTDEGPWGQSHLVRADRASWRNRLWQDFRDLIWRARPST